VHGNYIFRGKTFGLPWLHCTPIALVSARRMMKKRAKKAFVFRCRMMPPYPEMVTVPV
jgi:hypothetical protein